MLTPKQELFCQKCITLPTASDAYRAAYSAENMKAETIHKRASELLSSGEVAGRVKELRAALEERHKITVDDLILELEEAREQARNLNVPQLSVAVSATMGKAKMLGYLSDKIELGGKVTMEVATTEELQATLQAMLAKLK